MTKAAELAKMGEVLTNSQIGGRRNMVINGAMLVAQRGTSFSSIADNAYSLDRWLYYENGDSVSDASQSTDTPNNNFKNSLKLDVQTADTSVATGDLTCFLQKIEGLNTYQLGWGTSDAETVTLSFWVKSTKTGIHSGAFKNSAQDRSYVFEYTVNASNTWEYKTITVAGDTSGTWLTTNGIGVQVTFALMAGTVFTKTAGSWGAGNNYGSDNQVNVMDSASNEWYITGVQLEVGEVATPFEHRSFGEELRLAQRYHYRINGKASGNTTIGMGFSNVATQSYSHIALPVNMRTSPSVTGSGFTASDFNSYTRTGTSLQISGAENSSQGCSRTNLIVNVSSGLTTLRPSGNALTASTSSFCAFDSEL